MKLACTLRLFGRIAQNSFKTTVCSQKIEAPSYIHKFSTIKQPDTETTILDSISYDKVCSETLDSLCYYFEEITEKATYLGSTDVTYGDGVLTVNLGQEFGTYVINRQTPNKQIWLSSPTSGPKRYDFVGPHVEKGSWIYKHSGESLHELLQNEIATIVKEEVDFFTLPYSKKP